MFGNHELDETFQIKRDDLKLPETVSLLAEVLGNSFTAGDVDGIAPILEVETEQQTEHDCINFDDLALWALERAE